METNDSEAVVHTWGTFNCTKGLLFLAISLFLPACEEEPVEYMDNTRSIKTITISEQSSGLLYRFPGMVEASDTSRISFEVDGNAREVNVRVGDHVEEGQVLATLDEKPFQLYVEAAEAELAKAKAQLAEKESEFGRTETLYKKDWVAKAAYDQAVAARDSAVNQVSYRTSQLNLARRDLEKTVLAAPFDGVIADKLVDPFQEVARGETMFEIYAEAGMEVLVSLPETAIGKVYLGLPAQIRFPSDGIPTHEGEISEIGTVSREGNAFPIKVAIFDRSDRILPGMTVEVTFVVREAADSISYLLPFSAIAAGEATGQGYVFVFDPESSTVKKTEVRRGKQLVEGNRVGVNQGVEPGDVIAVTGVSFLRDGQKVRLLSDQGQ